MTQNFTCPGLQQGNSFYEKYKLAASKKPRESKYYIKFAIFKPCEA